MAGLQRQGGRSHCIAGLGPCEQRRGRSRAISAIAFKSTHPSVCVHILVCIFVYVNIHTFGLYFLYTNYTNARTVPSHNLGNSNLKARISQGPVRDAAS